MFHPILRFLWIDDSLPSLQAFICAYARINACKPHKSRLSLGTGSIQSVSHFEYHLYTICLELSGKSKEATWKPPKAGWEVTGLTWRHTKSENFRIKNVSRKFHRNVWVFFFLPSPDLFHGVHVTRQHRSSTVLLYFEYQPIFSTELKHLF